MLLVLHLLDKLWTWDESIDDVDSEHLHDVLIFVGLELAHEDVAMLPGIAQRCLGI